MIFGTQYERFPNPRPEDWESDLKHMKAMGFSVVRTWLYWRLVNPEPGRWDFSHYDRLFALAEASGIQVQIQLFLEAPPEHLVKAHPDWLYENRKGEYQDLIAIPAQQVGGFCGFDLMKPAPRAEAKAYIRQTAEHFRDHPALWGYDVWNEIWLSRWLDSAACQKRRAAFLRAKYKTLETLNQAHVARYTAFEEAVDPRLATEHGGKKPVSDTVLGNMDALEFENVLEAELMDWRAAMVRASDGKHPVVSHIGSGNGHELRKNSWALSRSLDAWGTSIHEGSLEKHLLPMHVSREAAGGKPWWLAENSSGSMWMGLNSFKRSALFVQSTLTIAQMLKAAGVMFWQYRPEIKDGESPNFGLVKLDGQDTSRSRIVADFITSTQKHQALLDAAKLPASPIGLVYAAAVGLADVLAGNDLFADFHGWYAALAQNGCLPRIVRDIDLAVAIPADLRLLILPMQVIETSGLRQALLNWVEAGGVLVASGQTFLYDPLLYAQRQYPGVDLFGVEQDETDPYDGFVRYFRADTDYDFPAGGRRVDCIPQGTDVIGAAEDGRPLVTLHRFGQGQSIWFGCSPGRKHTYSVIDGFTQVVGDLISTAGIRPAISCTHGVVSCACPVQDGWVLFLVNLTGKALTTWVRLHDQAMRSASDLLSDTDLYRGEPADRFPVPLLAEQSKIIFLPIHA